MGDARDVTVTPAKAPEVTAYAQATEIQFDAPPPRFQGAANDEIGTVRFRCPHCGIAHQAAVLPQSPRIAKFRCRQCEHTIEIETRPSAMDAIEDEFNLRLDMKELEERKKAFSLPSSKEY